MYLRLHLQFLIIFTGTKIINFCEVNMPKKWFETTKGVINISQLALMLLTPIIFSIILGYFLQDKLDLDNWVMGVCVLIGFVIGIASFISYLFKMAQDFDKKD